VRLPIDAAVSVACQPQQRSDDGRGSVPLSFIRRLHRTSQLHISQYRASFAAAGRPVESWPHALWTTNGN